MKDVKNSSWMIYVWNLMMRITDITHRYNKKVNSTDVCLFRLIATPLAALLGVTEKSRYKVEHNAVLEHHFITKSKHPGQVTSSPLTQHHSQIFGLITGENHCFRH